MTPNDTRITISELGQSNQFTSGNKYWNINWAKVDSTLFKIGFIVEWEDLADKKDKWFRAVIKQKDDPDSVKGKTYSGKIEWMIITDYGTVEISIDNPNITGRLNINEVKLVVSKKEIKKLNRFIKMCVKQFDHQYGVLIKTDKPIDEDASDGNTAIDIIADNIYALCSYYISDYEDTII